jgi:hypothetical protein
MLKELSRFENLGTPQYFLELLDNLRKSEKLWTIREVQEHFFNRIIDGRIVFDGCIPLLESLGIVKINGNQEIIINIESFEFLKSELYLRGKIIEKILLRLKKDKLFYKIFSSENISYDIIYHSIQINNSAFHFKFSNFKQLLIDFGFILVHPDKRIKKYIINPKYKKVFDAIILLEIKKRKIGIDELRKTIEQQQACGEEAEKFVLNFENKRLENKKNIAWVSEYWTNAGYDIASFNDKESDIQNRFIEVKSFSGLPNFFWSRNEIETARVKKNKYFLYLVNRNDIHIEGYIPIIIQNPYESILKNEIWDKRIEKYFISKKDELDVLVLDCPSEI